MGRNPKFARTASEEDPAQADAALMFYDSEDMASQPATATTTTTSATTTTTTTTTTAVTAGTSSSSTRQGRKAALTLRLQGSDLSTAATTTTATATITDSTAGAVSATAGPSGPSKRAPRATPTHLPPVLPATAREVTDVASLARVVTLLSGVIEKAVHDGKSVTAVNKRLISCAAEEIRRAAHALTRASPAEPQRTTDQPTTTLPDATGLGGLKEELVACVRAEITKLKAELGGARPGRPPPDATAAASFTSRSYAQALGSSSRPARRPTATHTAASPPAPRVSKPAIIVTAKKEAKTRQDAVTAFRKSISFKDCKFAPIQVKPVSGNKLRVEFETSGQRDDTLQRLQGSEQVSAEPARSLQPLIIVKGIDRDTPAEELVEIIRGQNPALNISNDDLRLKFKRTNRNPKLYNAVFTTRPALFRMITELGRVCIDHQRVHVEEFSPFIQCFCCLQFGHVRKNCSAQEEVCAFCAGSRHTEATCPARKLDGAVARCLNCANRNSKFDSKTDTRHNATSYSCSVLRAMKSRVESRVDYGSVQ